MIKFILGIIIGAVGVLVLFNKPEVKNIPDTEQGIMVTSPKEWETIKLPIDVRGYITGKDGWVANEGEAGAVQIFDANGRAVSELTALHAVTDWLTPPTSFEASVGDRQMMSEVETDTGTLKFISMGAKDGDQEKSFSLPVRFR